MKEKVLLMITLLSVFVGGAKAQEPAITLTAPAVERTITIGLNAAGKVQIDWGNGEKVEQEATAAYDGWDNALEFTGTPSGEVKIYGEGISYLQSFTKMVDGKVENGITAIDLSHATTITELDLHQNNLTALDLSKLTALDKLTIGVNKFETIDLSANTELTTFDANCTADGNLTSLDLSKNTKLSTLKANNNKIQTIDLSKNLSLKTVYLLGNGLTAVNFGENTTAKIYISLNNNKLEKKLEAVAAEHADVEVAGEVHGETAHYGRSIGAERKRTAVAPLGKVTFLVDVAIVVDSPIFGIACNLTELDGVDLGTQPDGKRNVRLEERSVKGAEQETHAHRDGEDFVVDRLLEQLRVLCFEINKGGFCLQVYLAAPIRAFEISCIYGCSQEQKGQK